MILQASRKPFIRIQASTVVNGTPAQRFHKPIMRVGEFHKEDQIFEVTSKTLNHWVDTFQTMKKNGVKVSIPNEHSGEGDPEKNHGWVEDMFVDNDELVMVCDIIGESSIAATAKSDVSIKSPLEFIDGNGVKYTRPIVHVAMCTDPVVTGLGEFVPIAASKEKVLEMDWKNLQKGLSFKDGLTDESASELILNHVKGLNDKIAKLKADMKASTEKKVDPLLVKLASDNRGMKLSALVASARITPATKEKLYAIYADVESLTLELSTGAVNQFDELIVALAENDPVKLKEQTGPQTLILSDESKGKDENFLLADAKARRKAAEVN